MKDKDFEENSVRDDVPWPTPSDIPPPYEDMGPEPTDEALSNTRFKAPPDPEWNERPRDTAIEYKARFDSKLADLQEVVQQQQVLRVLLEEKEVQRRRLRAQLDQGDV